MKRTREIWRSMWKRCGGLKGNCVGAKKYKGIIFVSENWRTFEGFIADMGLAPDGYTLDRRDNSKNYCKENCRWATPKTQTRNRGVTRTITYEGKEWFLQDLADHLGIRYDTLWTRLRANWPVTDLGKKPNRGYSGETKKSRKLSYQGEVVFLSDLAKQINTCSEVVWGRFKRGWGEKYWSLPIGETPPKED